MIVTEAGRWHTVRQGEWLETVAHGFRLPSDVIWDHPNNASLKTRRDPNVLYPGDQIFIPERRKRRTPCQTDKTHRFTLQRALVSFELTLLDPDGEPIKNERYTLGIIEPPLTGATDGDGHLTHDRLNPAKLKPGLLELPDAGLQFHVDIGTLNPSHAKADYKDESGSYDDGLSGVQMRLMNLGYDPGATDGRRAEPPRLPSRTIVAIQRFQRFEMRLPEDKITGELNDDTRDAINAKFTGT